MIKDLTAIKTVGTGEAFKAGSYLCKLEDVNIVPMKVWDRATNQLTEELEDKIVFDFSGFPGNSVLKLFARPTTSQRGALYKHLMAMEPSAPTGIWTSSSAVVEYLNSIVGNTYFGTVTVNEKGYNKLDSVAALPDSMKQAPRSGNYSYDLAGLPADQQEQGKQWAIKQGAEVQGLIVLSDKELPKLATLAVKQKTLGELFSGPEVVQSQFDADEIPF